MQLRACHIIGLSVCCWHVCLWLCIYRTICLLGNEWMNEWYFRVLFCILRLYKAVNNLGQWDEFYYESCNWCRINCSTCWPAVQQATTVPRMPPENAFESPRLIICLSVLAICWSNYICCSVLMQYDYITTKFFKALIFTVSGVKSTAHCFLTLGENEWMNEWLVF